MNKQRRGRGPNGRGMVRERSDGRWEARGTLPNSKQKSVYGKSEKEAVAKLQELQRQASEGRVIGTGRQTVAQYLTDWLEQRGGAQEPPPDL